MGRPIGFHRGLCVIAGGALLRSSGLCRKIRIAGSNSPRRRRLQLQHFPAEATPPGHGPEAGTASHKGWRHLIGWLRLELDGGLSVNFRREERIFVE